MTAPQPLPDLILVRGRQPPVTTRHTTSSNQEVLR
jgi:hypothetical protein